MIIEHVYLPNQSGSSEPARDSEYLLPVKEQKKTQINKCDFGEIMPISWGGIGGGRG